MARSSRRDDGSLIAARRANGPRLDRARPLGFNTPGVAFRVVAYGRFLVVLLLLVPVLVAALAAQLALFMLQQYTPPLYPPFGQLTLLPLGPVPDCAEASVTANSNAAAATNTIIFIFPSFCSSTIV
jgi:hypothetical protein